ncbi:inositol polyphosphate multikinase [Colossoma macropomum]|uniref:inositol polyphosphate multikinase n=1 Tax=Colossoma macropomum TaxID=42526 RepID=UPI0018651768|nr:inositol polyphosphate multikinase [Colossoma macropomum]
MATEDRVVDSSLAVDALEADGPAVEQRPSGCVPLPHQVAGHKYGISKVGILQHPDGTVLKQLQPPPRGPREMHFYKQVYAQACTDPQLLALQQHLPRYYGTWASSESPNEVYLKLEDVTRRFACPCIMDVKIGRKSYDPFASREKREEQIRKYPPMEEVGFLLLGMRVYQVNSESYISHDQFYGRSLRQETLKTGLAQFFHNGVELRKDAVSLSICKIRDILRWFEGQKQLHFYASSLLFVYEGSPRLANGIKWREDAQTRQENGQGELECNNNIHLANCKLRGHRCSLASQRSACGWLNCSDLPQDIQYVRHKNGIWPHSLHYHLEQANGNGVSSEEDTKNMRVVDGRSTGLGKGRLRDGFGEKEEDVDVRMIDFAHVFPSDSPDEGYMYGLKNLLSVLEQILKN